MPRELEVVTIFGNSEDATIDQDAATAITLAPRPSPLAPDTNRHITQSTVNEILTTLLRRYYLHAARAAGLDRAAASLYAGEQAAKYTIHSLRHMFAWTLHKASGNNIKMVQEKLGHHDVSTTMRYLEHLEEPVDDHSALIARQLGLAI